MPPIATARSVAVVRAAAHPPARPVRAACALLALVALPLVRRVVGPEDTLVLRVAADGELRRPVLRLRRDWSSSTRERPIAAALVTRRPGATVEVEIAPLPRRDGTFPRVVKLRGVSSPCGRPFEPTRVTPAALVWRDAAGARTVLWTNDGQAFRYRGRLCSPVEVTLVAQPYGGQARVRLRRGHTVLGERVARLGAIPAPRTAAVPLRFAWPQPASRARLVVRVPSDARDVRVLLPGATAATVRAGPWTSSGRGAAPTVRAAPGGLEVAIPRSPAAAGATDVAVALALWLFAWLLLEARGADSGLGVAARHAWRWGRFGAPALVVWLLYWLAFFPGVVSPDPVAQWTEILLGRYTSWHPAAHTALLRLLGWPLGSVAPVAALQIVLGAALIARWLALAHRLGAPGWLVWASAGWLAAAPPYGWNMMAVWKDTPYGLAIVWATLLVLLAVERGRLGVRRGLWLGVALAAVWLLRHNGPLVALALLAMSAWQFRRATAAGVFAAAATCAVLVIGVLGVGYRLAGVAAPSPVLRLAPAIHQVGAFVHAGVPVPPADRAFLERVLPWTEWRTRYDCASSFDMIFASDLLVDPVATDRLRAEPLRLPAIWARLAATRPDVLARHLACASRFVWWPDSALYIGPLDAAGNTVAPNAVGLRARSLAPALRDALLGVILHTMEPGTLWRALLWQPATALWVLCVAVAVALTRRRSPAALIPLVPALANTIVWLVIPLGPDWRFQWPVILLAPLTLALAAAPPQRTFTTSPSPPPSR